MVSQSLRFMWPDKGGFRAVGLYTIQPGFKKQKLDAQYI